MNPIELAAGPDAAAAPRRSCCGFSPFLLYVICFSAISGVLFGYDLCVVTVALEGLSGDFDLSEPQTELVVSIVMVGATLGALVGGPVSDIFGRWWCIFACSLSFLAGSFVMMVAPSFAVLLVGRFAVGLGVGASGMAASVYMAELSSPTTRGILVSVNELAVCTGCLVALGVDSALADQPAGWRWMLGLAAVPAAIQAVGMVWMPESPRWMAHRGSPAAADRVWRRLHGEPFAFAAAQRRQEQDEANGEASRAGGSDCSPAVFLGDGAAASPSAGTPDDSASGSAMLTPTVAAPAGTHHRHAASDGPEWTSGAEASWSGERGAPATASGAKGEAPAKSFSEVLSVLRAAWANPVHSRMMLLAVGVALAQNLTFANAMLYYSHQIFERAGIGSANEASVGVGVAKFVGVGLSLFLVERWGRRWMLLVGTAGQFASLLLISAAFAMSSEDGSSTGGATAALLVGVFAFIFFWDISWAPLMWVVCSEVMPASIRGVGMGVALAAFWASGVATNQLLLSMVDALGAGAFLLVALTSAAGFVFVFVAVPETKGQPLEAIEAQFEAAVRRSRNGAMCGCRGPRPEGSLRPLTGDAEAGDADATASLRSSPPSSKSKPLDGYGSIDSGAGEAGSQA